MSNRAIILKLKHQLADYENGKLKKYDFTAYLVSSIDALEGVDYTNILMAREFQYRFEVAEFSDEDATIEDIQKVTQDFKSWLNSLE